MSEIPATKICALCGEMKPLDQFPRRQANKESRRSRCNPCRSKERRERYQAGKVEPHLLPQGTKTCTTCNETKDLADFQYSAESKDRRVAECRACAAKALSVYRAEHPEQTKAHWTASNHKHREEHKQRSKDYYHRLTQEERQALHQERSEYQAAYQRENRNKIRIQRIGYRQRNPGMMAAIRRQRRALIAQAPINNLTHAQWEEIQKAQGYRCYYCQKRCKGHLTQDHLTPLSKGGSHTVQNVIAVCQSCNSKKRVGPPLTPVQPFLLTVAPAKKPKP